MSENHTSRFLGRPSETTDSSKGATAAAKNKSASSRVRSGEDFDIIIGFLGFWAVILFAATVWKELTGQPALVWAMALLVNVVLLAAMYKLRKKLPARQGRRSID